MEDIIKAYNDKRPLNNTNFEFELKFKDINVDMFNSVYNNLKTKYPPALECSINIISNDILNIKTKNVSYIRKMTFIKGEKFSDEYSIKKRIQGWFSPDTPKYTISLAEEAPNSAFKSNPNSTVRIKLRISFTYNDWRIDLTAVKQSKMSFLGDQLLPIKAALMPATMTADNFLNELNYDLIDQYELEAEFIGKDLTVEKVLDVSAMIREIIIQHNNDDIEYHEEIYKVAQQIVENKRLLGLFKNDYGLKRLCNQVVALSKTIYINEVYPPKGYFVTVKTDGIRCVCHLYDNICVLIADKVYKYTLNEKVPQCIFDCELIKKSSFNANVGAYDDIFIGGASGASSTIDDIILYIFDCMMIEGNIITSEMYKSRINHIPQIIEIFNKVAPKGVICAEKKIVKINDIQADFDSVYKAQYEFPIDGLIITEPMNGYSATKNYKWKPLEHTTIDFMAVKCPKNLLGVSPYDIKKDKDLYLLFVGVNHNMRMKLGLTLLPNYKKMFDAPGEYYPIQFSPSSDKYAYLYYHDPALGDIDYKVVELGKEVVDNKVTSGWKFIRVRSDRSHEKNYFGNDFKVAEITYMNYIDTFSYADLIAPNAGYFTRESSNAYVASNRYRRFVISILIRDNFSNADWIIDLAAGRGADLHRYQEVGVKNGLFIDIDATAIVELVRRKFEMFNIKKRRMQQWTETKPTDDNAMTVHTLVENLSNQKSVVINNIKGFVLPGTVDGIVCNFAIHYFCDQISNLRNLLSIVATMLKPNGVFMFTTLDGEKVFNLLKDLSQGEEYHIMVDCKKDDTKKASNVVDNAMEGAKNYFGGAIEALHSTPKYRIKKLYKAPTIAPVGQTIGVLLPFADELREEPLANISTIISECERLNLAIESNNSFDYYLDEFKRADSNLYSKLCPGDIEYISLHKFVTVRKIK
jgi:SAM-dependent methyltransferase